MTMRIGRVNSWYRPYGVVASGKGYTVKQINFYNENGIVVSTNSGWLEKSTLGDIESFELPIDEIKRKNVDKIKFDGTVFVTVEKESYSNEKVANLYIPCEMLNIQFVEYKKDYETQVRAIYTGDFDIKLDVFVKTIPNRLNEISNKYEEVLKKVEGYNLRRENESLFDNLDKLKVLAKEYVTEQERIQSLTVEEVI